MRGPPVLDREITMDLNPGAARPERVDHPSTPAKQKPEATPSHPPAPQLTTASRVSTIAYGSGGGPGAVTTGGSDSLPLDQQVAAPAATAGGGGSPLLGQHDPIICMAEDHQQHVD